jgi:hypothetical protein
VYLKEISSNYGEYQEYTFEGAVGTFNTHQALEPIDLNPSPSTFGREKD